MIERLAGIGALLIVLPAALAGQDPSASSQDERGVLVWGVVVDRNTGAPVGGADVHVGPDRSTGITGDNGRFHFTVPPGTYRMRITRIGYRLLTDTLDLDSGTTTRVRVEVVPEAVDLEPLVVTVSRRTLLEQVGFYDRQSTAIGTFLTRSDIERRQPRQFTDLVRTMPGVRAIPTGQYGDQLLRMRGNCEPALYIDGVRTLEGFSPDLALAPDQVEGIEVYRGAQVPMIYSRNACGAVVVWTRMPEPEPGGGASGWTHLRNAGIMGGLFLLGGFLLF